VKKEENNKQFSSPLLAFCALGKGPAKGIDLILQSRFRASTVILTLFLTGCTRLIAEIFLLFARKGQPEEFFNLILYGKYLNLWSGIFLIEIVTTTFVRVALYATIIHFLATIAGYKANFKNLLKLYSIALLIYPLPAIINMVYCFVSLPEIVYSTHSFYSPRQGVGQIITSLWMAYVSFLAAKKIVGCRGLVAWLLGLSIPLLDIALFVSFSMIFFGLIEKFPFSQQKLFGLASSFIIFMPLVVLGTYIKWALPHKEGY